MLRSDARGNSERTGYVLTFLVALLIGWVVWRRQLPLPRTLARELKTLEDRVQALETYIQRADLGEKTGETGLDRPPRALEGDK